MQATARRKISMAKRALDFALANPSTDASYVTVVGQLQVLVTRAESASVQQRDGLNDEHAAIAHRQDLREIIGEELHHLAAVAARVVTTDVELANRFVSPDPSGPNRAFITAAKSMLAAATPVEDQFVTLGLGETFVADLTQAIAEFDEATATAHAGRAGHVAASTDLIAVSGEVGRVVGVLDGLNRARFRQNQALQAAWESARNVVGPFRSQQGPGPEPAPAPAPVDPAAKQANTGAG
jgi:hypothetical protein